MNKVIWITTATILFTVFILPFILVLPVRYVPSGLQPSLGNTLGVYQKNEITQEFISTKDNLAGVAMSIKNPNFRNRQDLYLNVYDKENNQLRTVKINGANIADGDFVKFTFEPIPNSLNSIYTLVLSSHDTNMDEEFPVFFSDQKPPWAMRLDYFGEVVDGSLSFITLHTPKSKLVLIKEVCSNLFSRLLRIGY